MNDVKFNLGQGGLGRQLPNDDHVTGFLFDVAQPTAFGTDKMLSFRSIEQVEAKGIIASDPTYALAHYTAKEFFRKHPEGLVFLGFQLTDASIIINLSQGRIRQYGVFDSIANIATYQTLMENLRTQHAPAICVIGATGITDMGDSLQTPDLHTLDAEYVSVLVAGDGSADGKALATSFGVPYVAAIGAVLGAMSSARVSDSIAWVKQYNYAVAQGELDEPIFADGDALSAYTSGDLDALNDKGYLFFRKFVGRSGSYLNDTFSATVLTSDYAYIENNRTIQKAERLLYAALLPEINSPLNVNPADGTLDVSTIGYFESLCDKTLRENMLANGELSGDEENPGYTITIDPEQDVLGSGVLEVAVKLVPVGVAREIIVTLGFAVSVG